MRNLLVRMSAVALVLVSGTALAENQVATLTESGVMLNAPSLTEAKLLDCQPMAGQRVGVLEVMNAVDGMPGVSAARVRVLAGQCEGQEGWVGLARLKAAE